MMPKLTTFKSSIPMGMRVFEHSVDVAVNKRIRAARNFAKRHKRRIYLSRARCDKVDTHAIRVIGKSKGWFFERRECIGYVPPDIADKLLRTNMDDKVKLRLHMISIEDKHSIGVRFDIFGPKNDYEGYSSVF